MFLKSLPKIIRSLPIIGLSVMMGQGSYLMARDAEKLVGWPRAIDKLISISGFSWAIALIVFGITSLVLEIIPQELSPQEESSIRPPTYKTNFNPRFTWRL